MRGFLEVTPLELVKVIDESELEPDLLIGGMSDIDMYVRRTSGSAIPTTHAACRDDWTKVTDYRGYEKTDKTRSPSGS